MKVSFSKDQLLIALTSIASSIEKKSALPQLGCALFKVRGDLCTITGSDLEIEISETITVETPPTADCEFLLPFHKLKDIVSSCKEEATVNITRKEEYTFKVTFSGGRSTYTLKSYATDSFPNIEHGMSTKQNSVEINTKTLSAMISAIATKMPGEDVRYYLNGAKFEVTEGFLKLIATDGHRLSIVKEATPCDLNIEAIVPKKAVLALEKMCNSINTTLILQFDYNHLHIKTPTTTFTSKLIDGRYPDYKRVLPKANETSVVINKQLLLDAAARASILCNEKLKAARFHFYTTGLVLKANNPEQESSFEEIDCVSCADKSIETGFNLNYIKDAITALSGENINIELKDENTSAVFYCEDNPHHIEICMPVRL